MSETVELTANTWTKIAIGKDYTILELYPINRTVRYSFTQNDTTGGFPLSGGLIADRDVYITFVGTTGEKINCTVARR